MQCIDSIKNAIQAHYIKVNKFRIERREDLSTIGNNILSFQYNLNGDFESDILTTLNYIKQLVNEHLYLFDQMCKDFTLNKQSFLNPNNTNNIHNMSQSNFTINNDHSNFNANPHTELSSNNRKTTFNPSNVNVVYPLNLDNLETRTVSTISRSNISYKNMDHSRIINDNSRIEQDYNNNRNDEFGGRRDTDFEIMGNFNKD